MCVECRVNVQLAKQMLKAVEHPDAPASVEDVWRDVSKKTVDLYLHHAFDVTEGLKAAGFEIREV